MNISHTKISLKEQVGLIQKLSSRSDTEAKRMLRLLDLPDLCRVKGHPIQLMIDNILSLPLYQNATLIDIPEIASTKIIFDLFNFPADHPARNKSDTYYIDDEHVLRPHTTTMRRYYLESEGIRDKLAKEGEAMAISYGKVYRKDEIDRTHFNVFHNIDCLYICKKEKQIINEDTLKAVLTELTAGIYGEETVYKIVEDYNPYTEPTLEIEVEWDNDWMEVLGSGVLRPESICLLGLDPNMYNGWAWGPGLDRLVMQKMKVPDIRILWSQDERITSQRGDLDTIYQPVSKFPSTYRDISFIIPKAVKLNDYYEIIKGIDTTNLIEQVELLDDYENDQKFGIESKSYTFRIVYRSFERTLTNNEINDIQTEIRNSTVSVLGATLR